MQIIVAAYSIGYCLGGARLRAAGKFLEVLMLNNGFLMLKLQARRNKTTSSDNDHSRAEITDPIP